VLVATKQLHKRTNPTAQKHNNNKQKGFALQPSTVQFPKSRNPEIPKSRNLEIQWIFTLFAGFFYIITILNRGKTS
jgi:hypothetical protein